MTSPGTGGRLTVEPAAASPVAGRPSRWTEQRWVRPLVLGACVVLVLGFYVRSATSYGKSLAPAPEQGDFQNLQADAFLEGRLDLPVDVPPGLAELADPYDPVANLAYRADNNMHDLSYVDGRVYSYFGPAPVLLLYLPFRILDVGELPPTLATLLFGIGGFLGSWAAFRVLATRFVGTITVGLEAMAVLALGLAAPIGWLIYIGRPYEVPIACGYFLVMVGLFLLCRGLFSATARPVLHLAFGSLALAGAVAARPTLVWGVLFSVFATWCVAKRASTTSVDLRRAALAVWLPWIGVGAALAWYNWTRFGAVSEFGTNFMLSGENVRLARQNEVDLLVRGMYHYFVAPWRWQSDLPLPQLRPLLYPTPIETGYIEEPVAGLAPLLPASLAGVVLYFCQPVRRWRQQPWLVGLLGVLVAFGLVVAATVSYRIHGATMRYVVDFAPVLLLASVTGFVAVVATSRPGWHRQLLLAVGIAVLAWSVIGSVAITTYPCAGTGSC